MVPSGGQRPLFVGGVTSTMVTSMPVTTTSVLHQVQAVSGIHHSIVPQVSVIKHEPMEVSPGVRVTADLYLCDSGNVESRGRPAEEPNEKASVALLDQEYNQLTQKKIKDSLSSFVPDIPGEFDSSSNPESMLRTLIDRPPIGGREFLPLSEQSLLGFRLHPGPLPEQYRLDPMTLSEPHRPHHKKKKKHKHKHVDKTEEASITNYSPPISREHTPPGDPCDFIKPENAINFFPSQENTRTPTHHLPQPQPHSQPQPQPHLYQHTTSSSHTPTIFQQPGIPFLVPSSMGVGSSTPQSVIVGGKTYSAVQAAYLSGPGPATAAILNPAMKIPAKPKKKRHNVEGGPEGVPKKKKKKDKDKEKNKEKKKKKHHNPDQPPGGPLPTPSSSTIVPSYPSPLIAPPFSSLHPSQQ